MPTSGTGIIRLMPELCVEFWTLPLELVTLIPVEARDTPPTENPLVRPPGTDERLSPTPSLEPRLKPDWNDAACPFWEWSPTEAPSTELKVISWEVSLPPSLLRTPFTDISAFPIGVGTPRVPPRPTPSGPRLIPSLAKPMSK